jgi:hypothetical protein
MEGIIMRIGEVNQDNYKQMLKILGVKDTTNLDKLSKKSNKLESEQSWEDIVAAQVKAGYVEEGMVVREGDTSWRKIVPVSYSIKNKLIEVARRQFLENGNGMSPARDGDELGAIYREYRKGIAPSDRLSVTYTMSQIVRAENQRLIDYVRANVPGWTYGQKIPADVLRDAVSGKGHLDVKA